MENLFRNDINDIRQIIQAETDERKSFMDTVTAFMLFVNGTLLSDSHVSRSDEPSKHEEFHENARLLLMTLRTAFSSLKKVSKSSNETMENLKEDIKYVKTSLVDIEQTLSRVDDTCAKLFMSVCSCDGWLKKNNRCFQDFDFQKSWYDAEAHCRNFNGHLAIIEDQETNDFIAEGLNEYEYFIDGTDVDQEGRWIWNSTGKEIEFTNWLYGQPDNFKTKEHCLVLRGRYYGYLWNDMPCDMELPFVCQRPCILPS